jgi:hypothetical protein
MASHRAGTAAIQPMACRLLIAEEQAMKRQIIIIGAGMAGLACAQRLAQMGLAPLVVDKGRGIGGRIATRRLTLAADAISFDHGAQYLKTHDAGFAAAMAQLGTTCDAWEAAGVGNALVGVPGMSSIPRAMAAGLDVLSGIEIETVRRQAGQWELITGTTAFIADQLVISVPAPQAANLLGPNHALHAQLLQVRMLPCLTLLAAFPSDAPQPFTASLADDQPLAWIAKDNSKPGRSDAITTWVAQASAAWSEQHLESPPEVAAGQMLDMLCERIGAKREAVIYSAVHRWRYAQACEPIGLPFLASDDGSLHVGGDWCLGTRVADAWRSGIAIANAILSQ